MSSNGVTGSVNTKTGLIPQYKIGDLVWSPWSSVLWPAMISYDPSKAIYFRVSPSKNITHYHIQYFGIVAQRGWVPVKSIQPVRSVHENGKSKPQKKTLWKDFEVGIDELKRANALSIKERKLTFIFDYGGCSSGSKKKKNDKPKVDKKPQSDDVTTKPIVTLEATEEDEPQLIITETKDSQPSSTSPPPSEVSSSNKVLNVSPRSTASPYSLRDKITLTQRKINALATCSPLSEVGTVTPEPLLIGTTPTVANGGEEETHSSTNRECVTNAGGTDNGGEGRKRHGRMQDTSLFPPGPPPLPSGANTFTSCTDDLLTPPSTDTDSDSLDISIPASSHLKKQTKPDLALASSSTEDTGSPSLPPPSSFSSLPLPPPSTNICSICDNPSNPTQCIITCKGHCLNSFHVDCLGLISPPSFPFVCDECTLSPSVCYACKKPSVDPVSSLVPCSHHSCSQLYHLSCIRSCGNFKFDSSNPNVILSCGLHSCAKCVCSDGPPVTGNQKLMQCLKCPLSLHKYSCLIAGCEVLSDKTMICYRHLSISSSMPQSLRHFNMNTCLDCGEPGSLICCDSCSAAYHVKCLPDEDQSRAGQERWLCPNCVSYDLPTYGSIVMVKCGAYRWWPAEVVLPCDISDSFRNSKPTQCMFLVRFFSSNQYFWTHHGRVLAFTEECAIVKENKSHKQQPLSYINAFQEALTALREQESRPAKKESKSFVHIKRNKYLTSRPPLETETEPCKCTESSPCGPSSNCINRAIFTECSTENCPAGDKCQNQRMLRNESVPTQTFYTGNRGWGLKTMRSLSPGDFVIEYVGEIVDMAAVQERLKKTQEASVSSFYFLTLERNLIIDARVKSNHARFINHSCDPNCETQKWTVNGETRIGIFAIKDIKEDTELTFDYQFDCLGNEKKACLCGAQNCSGFLGEKPKQEKLKQEKPQPPSSSRKGTGKRARSFNKDQARVKQRKIEGEGRSARSAARREASKPGDLIREGNVEYIVMPPPSSTCSSRKSGTKLKEKLVNKEKKGPGEGPVGSLKALPVKGREGGGGGKAKSLSTKENFVPFFDINRKRKAPSIMKTAKQRKEDPYDDECFICNEGGDLVICDYPDCYKVYHLSCIGLKELPDGDFHCRRHSCFVCGDTKAEYHCFYCPRAFCETHHREKFIVTDSASFKCIKTCYSPS
ncbi:PREDICTED: histone-lysine N-methyltransferase NSD2-like [Amphimedon queenslandica]|uniref:Histone-lysine N-methyltransferase n=1 Tax=Amphimedon queenslandica TaxID=400682 RepID=A0A1X7VFC8_AMPQE|nr:PREDICTED: histone-lysine N-methyltransferase NSD2-like [Amphimedon queenslandica]XP_019849342.1 PREDICTED: histone-lysine N-methyltransferase NSD2-like [Amphimedon queenslandica]|eukprot:XP_019849341.1 PREDICTED: histone-lysine N-methyltransferase NSD2-like [Amphimedon queenslandica]